MSQAANDLVEFEGFRIDLGERTFWRQGELVPLAPKVLETLCVLVERRGRLVTKDELIEKIWPDSFVEERNLTQNIFLLRKVLGNNLIETVPRRGYRFTGEVVPVEGTVAITHHKKVSITAEGAVSRRELTNTVRDLARSLQPDGETRIALQPPATHRRHSYRFLALVILIVGAGAVAWSWQNNYLSFLTWAAVSENKAPIIDYDLLTESGNAFFPSVSPDKKYVAYVVNERGKFGLVLQHLPTRSVTQVLSAQPHELRSPQFSPDGHHLFYAARDGKSASTIYKIPIFGGAPQQIVTNVDQNFSISNDGGQLAFFRHAPEIKGNHLVTCRIDGSAERIVTSRGGKTAFRIWGAIPGWSPDDAKIVAVVLNVVPAPGEADKSYFVEIDVNTGREERLKAPDWEIAFQAYWLPDGSGLIAQVQERSDSGFQLQKLTYPTGEVAPVTNDTNNYTEFRLAPDASFIIASEEKSPYNLQLISADSPDQVEQLTDSAAIQRGYLGLTWFPDGKQLVFVQLEGLAAGNMWRMDVETREMRQLTFDKGAWNRLPSVTPDGNSIVFASNRSGTWHIWQMDRDGSNLRQITDGDGENWPQLSPDGKWLVYATPPVVPNTLWKRPIEGGSPIKLLDGALGKSSISPDQKRVIANYYDSNENAKDRWKYVILPFEAAGQGMEDAGFSTQHQIVQWKNDSTGVYFLSRGQSHTNIWFCDLEDGAKRPVTNFDSQEIAGLSVSPNGKTFAVARGKRVSNLFRISGF